MLKADNLKKNYHQASQVVEVLHGVNLAVKKGESVAIVGYSGSGKSTLLSLLCGLDHPSAGDVSIDGVSLAGLDEDGLAKFRGKHVGIVFQKFHLMNHLTAVENVALPLEMASVANAEAKAKDALALVGLSHRLEHFPSQLSGGECQRVAIARAFVTSPGIIFADEPSGNLDDKTGTQVMELLFNLVKHSKTTLVLVTHNHELARKCERVYELKGGSLQVL
jgi:putative ABC transport system ATP-binding protein